MWARLDVDFSDHPKVLAAGDAIGRNGAAIAIGVYALGLLWSNKHLTDGHLPIAAIQTFRRHVHDPIAVADALARAGLWEKNGSGFVIHDYAEFGNPNAAKVKEYRKRERERKARWRAMRHGGTTTGHRAPSQRDSHGTPRARKRKSNE